MGFAAAKGIGEGDLSGGACAAFGNRCRSVCGSVSIIPLRGSLRIRGEYKDKDQYHKKACQHATYGMLCVL